MGWQSTRSRGAAASARRALLATLIRCMRCAICCAAIAPRHMAIDGISIDGGAAFTSKKRHSNCVASDATRNRYLECVSYTMHMYLRLGAVAPSHDQCSSRGAVAPNLIGILRNALQELRYNLSRCQL